MATADATDALRRALGSDRIDFEAAAAAGPLPEPRLYRARDGEWLFYRRYGADADDAATTLIFFHGSSGSDDYLAPLGRAVAAGTNVAVVAPTLRGHGRTPRRRGDVDHPDQLLDDIEDLIAHMAAPRILLGGHSSGGGLALKYALERGTRAIAGLVLAAPFVHYRAATNRPGTGGWAKVNVARLLALRLLAARGSTRFAHRTVIRFNVPPELRRPWTTDAYSYLMLNSLSPRDGYRARLAALDVPVAVIAAADDGLFIAEKFAEVFAPAPDARVEIVPGAGHLDIAMQPPGLDRIVAAVRAMAG